MVGIEWKFVLSFLEGVIEVIVDTRSGIVIEVCMVLDFCFGGFWRSLRLRFYFCGGIKKAIRRVEGSSFCRSRSSG